MRDKVLKSDKYKQAMRDGTLDSKTLTIVPRKDYTLEEEESRDIYQEIVEGFKALKLTKEDQEILHALGGEEFSFEAMQEIWDKIPD